MTEYEGILFSDYYGAGDFSISPADVGVAPGTDEWDNLMEPIVEHSKQLREQMDTGDVILYDGFYVEKTSNGFVLKVEETAVERASKKLRKAVKRYLPCEKH